MPRSKRSCRPFTLSEKGVFRPLGQVDLPERSEVLFEPRLLNGKPGDLKGVYDVLSKRFASGEYDAAARRPSAMNPNTVFLDTVGLLAA